MTWPTSPIGKDYPESQRLRALATALGNADPQTRSRALDKVRQWTDAIEAMSSGRVVVGERAPIQDTPAWATPEVLHGGFASGALAAGGPLQDWERVVAVSLGLGPRPGRGAVNRAFLSSAGLSQLMQSLASGAYRLTQPEEGALLVVAWLLVQDRVAEAREVLGAIEPWFDKLRFYPPPTERPQTPTALVHRKPVGDVIRSLKGVRTSPQVQRMREAVQLWAPLTDEALELFLETVRGPPPESTTDGIDGGWPCAHFPPDWWDRARGWLDRDRDLRKRGDTHNGRPVRAKSTHGKIRQVLDAAVKRGRFEDGEVRRIRSLLATTRKKRGLPQEPRHSELRAAQEANAARPEHADLAALVIRRLAPFPHTDGVSDLEAIIAPVRASEANTQVPEGANIHHGIVRKTARAWSATIEELVGAGVLPSAETLAEVVPQITSQVAAEGVDDPTARLLYSQLYRAFRQRRSLLLLDLQHQVRFDELPWVKALDRHRDAKPSAVANARQALERVAALTVLAYPQTPVPNPMLQELSALAAAAGVEVPLVEEIAADIFMGTFSGKFLVAAQLAARLLRGRLYARYFDLPIDDLLSMTASRRRWGTSTSEAFDALCGARASAIHGGKASPMATNGMVLEQQQVLTTQNLASLFGCLELDRVLVEQLDPMAEQTWDWMVRRMGQTPPTRHAELIQVKNVAYAWRQAVFYLSFLPPQAQRDWVDRANATLAHEQGRAARLGPVLDGLHDVIEGRPARRVLLGWTGGRHWLLGPTS